MDLYFDLITPPPLSEVEIFFSLLLNLSVSLSHFQEGVKEVFEEAILATLNPTDKKSTYICVLL